MTTTNPETLSALATIAQLTYSRFSTTGPVGGANGSLYTEITQIVNGPLGFQARAFFNETTNELVIAFTGTEGADDLDASEFLPDFLADFSLAVAGVSPQDLVAQAFIGQATTLAQLEVGLFGSFDVTYVGHSLGGFLAQTASASGPEGEVVVFNAPGAGGFLGLPENHPFPEDNFTYVYSDPSDWGAMGGAIHSAGRPLSDNIYHVPGAEGHDISTPDETGLADALANGAIPQPADGNIFWPVDEALQLLGVSSLLDHYDSGDAPAIDGTSGHDEIIGTSGDDVMYGLGGNDTLTGGKADDFIFGGAGDDMLSGNAGADTLDGGAGDDWLNGGWGWDELIGGSGADRFYHHGVETGFGTEWIHDFSDTEGDRLVTGASGTAGDFTVSFATAEGRGSDDIAEAFIRYKPTGQIAWVLEDGAGLDEIRIQTADGGFDLLA